MRSGGFASGGGEKLFGFLFENVVKIEKKQKRQM